MIEDIKEFVIDTAGWGMTSVLAALASFVVGTWEHFHEKPVSSFIFACLSVLLFWTGSYKAWNKKQRELDHERSLHGGPEISFSWTAVPPLHTRKTLYLENTGTIDAYEVKVNDIGINKDHCGARFPVIAKCPRSSVSQLNFELYGDKVPQSHKNELEMVVYASGLSEFQKDSEGNDVVEFPIAVTFEEYGGARYEATFRFVADDYLSKVAIHRISRRRIP